MKAIRHPKIVIIGAGPAGSTASVFLSKHHIPHLLFDKETFPRDKVCGDALSGKVLSILNAINPQLKFQLQDISEFGVHCAGVRFGSPDGTLLDLPFSSQPVAEPVGFVIPRIDFDHWMVKQASSEYSEIRLGEGINRIERVGQKLHLFTHNGTSPIIADVIIAADGDHSIVRKTFGSRALSGWDVAAGLRAYVNGVTGFHPQNYIELHFLKGVNPGYIWLFPLGNGRANVGIGLAKSIIGRHKKPLKAIIEDILYTHPQLKDRFGKAAFVSGWKGWRLPFGSARWPLIDDGIMYLGDSGALVDPFTGEGIGNAMLSGMLAADHLAQISDQGSFGKAELKPYQDRVFARLGYEMETSRKILRLIQQEWLFNYLMRKANSSREFRETMSYMFTDIDSRAKLNNPLFYLKVLFSR